MTPEANKVYLIDDDTEMREATAQWLDLSGFVVQSFADAASALDHLNECVDGIVISDLRMPKMDGMALLGHLKELDGDVPVVLLTAHGDVQMAVDAMRRGAYDFIEKPFEPERLLDVVQRACDKYRLVSENRDLRRRLAEPVGLEQRLIGNSAVIRRLRDEILDVADTDASVLIQGETGTGKEVVARCLYEFGARKQGKYVAVNCGAIPENMFESELFGHERGAFTGADRRRIGRFEYAQGGVLFLDEIGSMPLSLQVKVLRALQEREVVRIGSNAPQPFDVRLICASNRDLLSACAAGKFREDLYYRINVVNLRVPSLRQRTEDILLLFDYFAVQAAAAYNRPEVSLQDADAGLLMSHDWPGNVRELKNIAERYVLSSLPQYQRLASILRQPELKDSTLQRSSLQDLMKDHERLLLEQALLRCQGDVQAVMDVLDLPRRTLNEKMTRHQLDRKKYV
ncbi:MAG: sigma-54 dependent transcriptional regulator [Deltaproteobacteria bacterium]|nr:sigma-54 dependent transcriptional regulator [Deltaproteobacteria bacterium]MCW8893411.1 sigma-54 dependent transcriptional regulator [Deltaproteobacteria bacterium]